MCSRFAVQEVGGTGACDFCFLGYLRKHFIRLLAQFNQRYLRRGQESLFTALFIIDYRRWPSDTSVNPHHVGEAYMMRLIKTAFATTHRA